MDDIEFMSNEELEQEFNELSECVCLMSWDMQQQADEFDYSLKNSFQVRLDALEKELVKRSIFVS